jgi:1-acyl-sn-glycerol-3-phosphate acyltransferase
LTRGPAFYPAVRAVFRCFALPYFRLRVRGAPRLPARGPGVVVALHRSWLDPAAVGAALPRPVRFLIMDRVYEKWWARWFYDRMGAIPVPAGGGRGAAPALRTALRRLREGELVGIFPEGGVRSHGDPDVVFPGAAMLAVRGRAPIIPVSIRGSGEAWPKGCRVPRPWAVSVEIGPPIVPPDGDSPRAIEEMVRTIEDVLRGMSGRGARGDTEAEEAAWTPR